MDFSKISLRTLAVYGRGGFAGEAGPMTRFGQLFEPVHVLRHAFLDCAFQQRPQKFPETVKFEFAIHHPVGAPGLQRDKLVFDRIERYGIGIRSRKLIRLVAA